MMVDALALLEFETRTATSSIGAHAKTTRRFSKVCHSEACEESFKFKKG